MTECSLNYDLDGSMYVIAKVSCARTLNVDTVDHAVMSAWMQTLLRRRFLSNFLTYYCFFLSLFLPITSVFPQFAFLLVSYPPPFVRLPIVLSSSETFVNHLWTVMYAVVATSRICQICFLNIDYLCYQQILVAELLTKVTYRWLLKQLLFIAFATTYTLFLTVKSYLYSKIANIFFTKIG